MPILFIIVILLCLYATQTGAFFEGVAYLFTPDFSKINGSIILAASQRDIPIYVTKPTAEATHKPLHGSGLFLLSFWLFITGL